MPRDELRKPLRKRPLAQRLWARRPGAVAAVAVLIALAYSGAGLWLSRLPAPPAGGPLATAAIPGIEELATSSLTSPAEAPAAGQPEELPAMEQAPAETEEPAGAEGAVEITVFDGEQEAPAAADPPAYHDEAAIIVAPRRALRPAPIAAVTEETGDGPLPRVSANGRRPFDVYSQVTPMAVLDSERPKIVLVLGGMGLSSRLTGKAIDELPGDVTLGFAPYGERLQEQVNRARARGHEVLLQVPMEPVGYPGANPGPRTLLSEAPAAENIAALRWHLSRFAGYSGITNYMGARLLVTEEALEPVMREVKRRGLVYLEDAGVSLTLSPRVARAVQLPLRRAAVTIDAEPTAPAIAAALERLEQEAVRSGLAIGMGSGLDVTIDTVAQWAKTLQDKGMLLVPVSAAYKGTRS